MKELLKRGDIAGPLVAAGTLLLYRSGGIWTHYHTAGIVVGVLLLVVAIALKIDEIQAGLGRRSTRLGIHSFTSIVLVLGILVILNYLGAQHFKQVDLTSDGMHSLSEQSTGIIEQIKDDVSIQAFFVASDQEFIARDSLKRYTALNPKIAVEFVDWQKHPDVAKAQGVTENGTLVIEMGDKKERIQKARFTEEDVTNALQKLVKGAKKIIYFVEGHGEKVLTDTGKDGASRANEQLTKENYEVKTLSLAREKKVPADAAAVVFMGPAAEPFQTEIDALDEYVQGGGSALIMLDPPPDTASMADFAKKWGVAVGDNLVVDLGFENQLQNTGPAVPLVGVYGNHPITEKFRKYTFFPLARSITSVMPPPEGVTVTPLLMTSQDSWAETDFKAIAAQKPIGMDPGKDMPGPVSLGVAVNKDQAENKKSRLVVIGDSDFASNSNFGVQGTSDLFVNAIAWLSRDESFITIRPKDPQSHSVTMTESQFNKFQILVLLLFPGSILVTGIIVRSSRR